MSNLRLPETIPPAVFLGFCAMQKRSLADWMDWNQVINSPPPPIEEICTTSACGGGWPENWFDIGDFNRSTCWDTEEQAWKTVPEDKRGEYAMYAFSVLPILFRKSGERQILAKDELFQVLLPELPAEPALDDFEFLGFDPAEYHEKKGYEDPTLGWGCSPLSCNGMAAEIPVNKHCLIPDLESALLVADRFAKEEPEPGPYMIFCVHRKRPKDE